MPRKTRKKRITTKQVQATENQPFTLPPVPVRPDLDDHEDTDADGLNMRRRAFVEHITGDCFGNAPKAAERAGYAADNRNALIAAASRLLRFVKVQEAIRVRLAAANLSADWTRRAIASYASASMEMFLSVDEDGTPRMDWKKAAACGAIGQVREFREKRVEMGETVVSVEQTFKIRDPIRALEILAKMHGLIDSGGTVEEAPQFRMRPVNRHADAGSN
jgi:hypothetical protein